ncbi:hypothetical protein BT69DRAFT_77222 [Atractiella rhizophila]|nr:hypothetical protein BT69DRAFT_77222 [Atractiella rhizophila]
MHSAGAFFPVRRYQNAVATSVAEVVAPTSSKKSLSPSIRSPESRRLEGESMESCIYSGHASFVLPKALSFKNRNHGAEGTIPSPSSLCRDRSLLYYGPSSSPPVHSETLLRSLWPPQNGRNHSASRLVGKGLASCEIRECVRVAVALLLRLDGWSKDGLLFLLSTWRRVII